MATQPNLMYIGMPKAGSTWLFGALNAHPDIDVAKCKDIYYFDRYFDKGMHWYLKHFDLQSNAKYTAEMSHDYIFCPDAASRISSTIGTEIKFLATLREPVSHVVSAFQFKRRNGMFNGTLVEFVARVGNEFRQKLAFSTNLARYADHFGTENICVCLFDDLKEDPDCFLRRIYQFLEVDFVPVAETSDFMRNAAQGARAVWLSRLTKRVSNSMRSAGFAELVTKAKTQPWLRKMLFSSNAPKPKVTPEIRKAINELFPIDEAKRVDDQFGTQLCEKWFQEDDRGTDT